MDPDRVDFLMRIMDTNNSGDIDYTELLVAATDSRTITAEHFKKAFAYFDVDNSGAITEDEIAQFLEEKEASKEEIRKIFNQMDADSNGEIDQ